MDAQREARISAIIAEQVPRLGKTLALDQVVAGLQAQTAELGRLERSIARLRHLRVGGLLLILFFGMLAGGGTVVGLYWKRYAAATQAERFVSRLNAAGIAAEVDDRADGVHLKIEGPGALRGTAWRKGADGYIRGADFVFPAENSR